MAIRLPPDEFIVRSPVLLLRMKYAEPSTNVLVTGITTVCVVLPVKKIVLVLATVSVVVPAAVAMLVKPKSMLLTAKFWLALRSTTLFAPEEAVTPVPPLVTGRVPVTAEVRLTLVMVLLEPLIVLLVSVSVPSVVTALSEG